MKSLAITLFLGFICTTSTFAAHTTPLTGRVVDTDANPIAFATVVLLSEGNQVAGSTTDSEGLFSLVANAGTYTLTVQHLNFENYSKEIQVSETNDLGDIILQESATHIDAVEVKAQLVRREADRFVVDVANSVSALGKDGVELLERAPGVWITDDKISINGKSGSKVYVNDRELKMNNEQLITYIKTLRAEEIQKIEVIPTTGADYDADSAGGIIKITLKRRRENGAQGSVQTSVTHNKYGTHWGPSANIALHSGKLDLNAATWLGDQQAEAHAEERTNYHMSGAQLESESHLDNDHRNYGGRMDAVYELTKHHSIGVGGRHTKSDENETNNSFSLLRRDDFNQETISEFTGSDAQSDLAGTFNYIWKIDTLGSTLKLLADYQVRKSEDHNNNHSLVNGIDSLYRDRTDSKYRMATTSIAWEHHLSPRIVLQAGGKYTYYRMQSDALYEYEKEHRWLKNDRESFHIDYNEQIVALYGIMRANFNRWSIVAGLRGEYTRTESDGTKLGKDYFSLFPNLNLSYRIEKTGKHSLIGQYARKISRPSFWQLNPQRNQISDYTYQTGNPYLNPSYTHDINLTFVAWYKYTLTAGMNLNTDEIQQNFLSDPNDPDLIIINHINYKETKQFYLSLNTPLQLAKWWEANTNLFYMAWEQRVTTDAPVRLHHMFTAYASTTFTLPAKFYIDLWWSYHNRIKMGNAVIGSAHTVNGSLKKRFGERFTLTLAVSNIFNSKQDVGASNEQFDRIYRLNQFWNDRKIQFNFVWNFKSGKAFRQRTLETSDENRL